MREPTFRTSKHLMSIRSGELAGWVAEAACTLPRRLLERSYSVLLKKLVHEAKEGHAWHADHIVPVYKGGGLCELDNLRTLCVACHADVTKQQCKVCASQPTSSASAPLAFWPPGRPPVYVSA